MSNIQPFFLTGANAKIIVNGTTLAFCTNLTYSIIVNHASPKALGMYESVSIEPLSYTVSGSFSVIKYVADVKGVTGTNPDSVNDKGDGIGSWGPTSLMERLKAGLKVSGADGRAYDSLDPSKLNKATGFQIDVFQKLPNKQQKAVARIRDARIIRADFNISKNTAATHTYQFSALYVDEDSFLADFSGMGQQWS